MNDFVPGGAKRVLMISSDDSSALSVARALPADGMLIVMHADPDRGAAARRSFAEAGVADRASVIIGDPARMLYKIAGPFDVIVRNDAAHAGEALGGALTKLLAPTGRLVRQTEMASDPVARALEKIAELNPTLNAFITVFEAEARSQPRPAGPLHGLPISIKDLIDIKGVPTTAASRARSGHVAAADATVVERLREAGAVIVGKTNLHEFALGTTNEESAFGPVRNPHDISRSPGGSSGGSAAAVASGMSWASIGTDTGGSIRIPAAACGVVGLKPSFGEIPTTGVFPLAVSLDHVGPLTRSVGDAWSVYEVLKGSSPSAAKTGAPVSQMRLGKLGGYFLQKLEPDVRRRFEEALDRLKSAGAIIVDAKIPHSSDIPLTYVRVALPEAYAVHAESLEANPDGYSESVRARLESGRDVPRKDYEEAQKHRGTLRAEVDAALSECDALVLPTLPIAAPKIGATTVTIGSAEEDVRSLMLRLTQLFNLTGHPAITLPCGTSSERLPCGLQLVGRRDGTVDLLRLSLGCEAHVTPMNPRARAREADRDPSQTGTAGS
jgi:aspartyl-tRNA(Asn)/glutamyl-tRNA(Gln) amidotransferase subunit A